MLTWGLVRDALDRDILGDPEAVSADRKFVGALFLEAGEDLLPDFLYIGTETAVQEAKRRGGRILGLSGGEASLCIVLCTQEKTGDSSNGSDVKETEKLCRIPVRLAPGEIYNRIFRALLKEQEKIRWRKSREEGEKRIRQEEFQEIVQSILEEEPDASTMAEERMARLPRPAYGIRFRMILFRFDFVPPMEKMRRLQKRIGREFPFSEQAVYRDSLLLFDRVKRESDFLPDADRETLRELAEEYGCYVGLGNTSKYLSAIPVMAQQSQAAIQFGRKIGREPGARVFSYEDYSMYFFIDMCAGESFSSYHHGKLFYLCHQGFLRIGRYDRKNHTNLMDILHEYLVNNCNMVQTAQRLYMHRNTLLNKIHLIEELIGESLNNSILQERLLFSYHVCEYVEKYLKKDLFPHERLD